MNNLKSIIVISLSTFVFIVSPTYAKRDSKNVKPNPLLTAQVSKPELPPSLSYTLAELEKIALQNNPTLKQAQAIIEATKGKAKQSGLLPNPVVGYQGEEYAFRRWTQRSEHFGFVEQTIPLGGKLKKASGIYQKEVTQAELKAIAQKQQITNTIRNLYFEILGEQELVDLHKDLSTLAGVTTSVTGELMNIGQADKPDFLAAEIEAEQEKHELVASRNNLSKTWALLASVMGTPDMPQQRLVGRLEERVPDFDEEIVRASLLSNSPQIRNAQAKVDRAQAVFKRALAEKVPDMFLRGGLGYSTELLDTNNNSGNLKPTGLDANVQIGFSLPIWNRNQGAIAQAKAEISFAEGEMARLKLALRANFAEAVGNYKNALDEVERYRQSIIPRAEASHQMYLNSFKQMSAAYPQVVIAQRTVFQAKKRYVTALVRLKQSAALLEGFLLTGGLDAPQLAAANNDYLQHVDSIRTGHDDPLDTSGLILY